MVKSFRWEEELRQSFLEKSCPSLWTRLNPNIKQRSLIESTCSEGRADWVWAGIENNWPEKIDLKKEVCKLLQQPTCSRILSSLKFSAPRTKKYLETRSGVEHTTFKKYLNLLLMNDLISSCENERYVLGSNFVNPKLEICSFEFKLQNWKRALYQAKRYRTFSHRVYVVMPPFIANKLVRHQDLFELFDVGLISHNLKGESEKLIDSKKKDPRLRRSFIQAIGLLLDQ